MASYKRKRKRKVNTKDFLSKRLTVRITSTDGLILKQIQHDLDRPVSRAAIVREALYAQYPDYFNQR